MHRSNESLLESESGPAALVKSLNGQLLEFIANHRPSVDLSTLEDREFFSKAKKTLKDGLKLLDKLVSLLPADDGVFVIVDSLSRLSGSRKDEDKVMERLEEIMNGRDDINVRVLVTNPLVGLYAKKVAERTLYVPDSVSGIGVIDVDAIGDELLRKVRIKDDDLEDDRIDNDEDDQ